MAHKTRKSPEHFTLLIVPHTEQPPIALRMPHWVVYACLLLVAVLAISLIFLVIDYRSTQDQLEALRQERQVELDRQRAMRQTILSQEDQVRTLTSETGRLSTDLSSLDRTVSDVIGEVRRIVGLDRLTPTPVVTTTPTLLPISPSSWEKLREPAGIDPQPQDTDRAPVIALNDEERAVTALSSRGSLAVASNSLLSAINGRNRLTSQLAELVQVRNAAKERVSKVDPDKRGDPLELQAQLVLYDAAPKLWPVQGPVTITSGFGQRQDPLESWLSAFHYGIDISAWYGTPVYATREGKVIFSGWEGNLGWTVEIQHEMGYKTLYGHNRAELAVRPGDMVKAGQRIAYASDSGRTTGPHVHYEIILNGKSLDPMKFLELPGGSRVQSQ